MKLNPNLTCGFKSVLSTATILMGLTSVKPIARKRHRKVTKWQKFNVILE